MLSFISSRPDPFLRCVAHQCSPSSLGLSFSEDSLLMLVSGDETTPLSSLGLRAGNCMAGDGRCRVTVAGPPLLRGLIGRRVIDGDLGKLRLVKTGH